MKVVEIGMVTKFQIKIGNKYVTVAELVYLYNRNLNGYFLYFYYYGQEFGEGDGRSRINGNVRIKLWQQEDEDWDEFIERVKKIVIKKLYVIGSSIFEEIKYIE